MSPQLIISVVTSKTQDGNLTKSGSNISNSVTHGCRCSDYYVGLNEVLYVTDSVNPKYVSLCSDDFSFLINPNGAKKVRYIGILSKILEFQSKSIFSANQVCAVGYFYNEKPCKLGGKQRLVTTYVI